MGKLKHFFIGKPKDPLSPKSQHALVLSIFFAWVGLGADGLSSACYGPEQSFLSLGHHQSLAFWLVLMTGITVFIIAFAYNRVISLFPNGGGGYKVATYLLGRNMGLIAGVALILDYILTIAISVASANKAIFSIFHYNRNAVLQLSDTIIILLLIYLNMRGMKESIKFLVFIFIGFIVLHAGLIIYGIFEHVGQFTNVYHHATSNWSGLSHQWGLIFVSSLLLHAYAQGGGTYTGLEAVSNNVNLLEAPRVKTGQWVMLYMSVALSLMAAGIMLLYLLWHVHAIPGETLNAVVFNEIIGGSAGGRIVVAITLLFEAGLLYVAANTGFLGGPAVLANMGVDKWVPKVFVNISSRLVRQNGIIFLGLAALFLIYITDGHVRILVIIYSLCVFLAFMLALAGLCKYYWNNKKDTVLSRISNLGLIGLGTLICVIIFIFVTISGFMQGSWIGLLLLAVSLYLCWHISQTYKEGDRMMESLDQALCPAIDDAQIEKVSLAPNKPTAVIFVGSSTGVGMHTLLNIINMFPNHYQNFIFVKAGVIDSNSFFEQEKIQALRESGKKDLEYFVSFCNKHGLAADYSLTLSVDLTEAIGNTVEKLEKQYPNATYFASQLLFPSNNWLHKILHNKTGLAIQRQLYSMGENMMILPVRMKI